MISNSKRKCRMCKNEGISKNADIDLIHHRLSLCKEHYKKWYERRVSRTIKKFKMISENDSVLIAVSGGKDSLALWYCLNNLGFNVDGIFIDLGIPRNSDESKEACLKLAEKLGRKLHIAKLEEFIAPLPSLEKMKIKPVCSLCGTLKRYYINKFARDLGYTVVATGHNLDDEVSVLFGNVLNWNIEYLQKQYPVLEKEMGFVKKIKPLCLNFDIENLYYCKFLEIEYKEGACPYSKKATSLQRKKILEQIEKEFPGAKLNFYLQFLKRIYPILGERVYRSPLRRCEICKEPSSNKVCSVCVIREKFDKFKI